MMSFSRPRLDAILNKKIQSIKTATAFIQLGNKTTQRIPQFAIPNSRIPSLPKGATNDTYPKKVNQREIETSSLHNLPAIKPGKQVQYVCIKLHSVIFKIWVYIYIFKKV